MLWVCFDAFEELAQVDQNLEVQGPDGVTSLEERLLFCVLYSAHEFSRGKNLV